MSENVRTDEELRLAGPRLYVLDDPHMGLAPATAETFNRMASAAADAGAAVILSTHALPVPQRCCDRFGIIHDGRLVRTMRIDGMGGTDLQDLFFRITATSPRGVGTFSTWLSYYLT